MKIPLTVYQKAKDSEKAEAVINQAEKEMPNFSVSVTPFEREGSNVRGLARIYIENCFIVNNVSILSGKEDSLFVAMPSYKTKQIGENNKPIYQNICYPVTKEFREKLYTGIVSEYEQAREKNQNRVRENTETQVDIPDKKQDREATPFR